MSRLDNKQRLDSRQQWLAAWVDIVKVSCKRKEKRNLMNQMQDIQAAGDMANFEQARRAYESDRQNRMDVADLRDARIHHYRWRLGSKNAGSPIYG